MYYFQLWFKKFGCTKEVNLKMDSQNIDVQCKCQTGEIVIQADYSNRLKSQVTEIDSQISSLEK